MFRPDPVIGWTLTPRHGVRPLIRKSVVQTVDGDGWRHVPGRPSTGPRVGIYGCSFVYGTCLADEETFVARLQHARPDLRMLNRGIGGHGTVQNLLQMRRDIASGLVDAAIFATITDHRFRIVPHPARMRAFLSPEWHDLGVEHLPVARHRPDGTLRIDYVRIWQPALGAAAFGPFLPDDHLLLRTLCDVLDLAEATARAAGLPVGTVLLDRVEPEVSDALLGMRPDMLDASVPYDSDHHFLPRDAHPNARGNEIFAARILPLVDRLLSERGQ
ncbi:hypothetical protein [Jannaschia formosa]|uniref:hypothetical protein n=1 Tax=Jannaschia formosa TaxID=2259592 RepID=UPI001FD7E12C|nr:hypothetical protein [Jannaschia formosa]